jgi:hypothetical protein
MKQKRLGKSPQAFSENKVARLSILIVGGCRIQFEKKKVAHMVQLFVE